MKTLLYLPLLCLSLSVLGQEPPPLRTVEFHIVDNSRIRNLRFGIFDEEGQLVQSTRMGFPTSGLSRKYTYTGPMPMVFFEEESVEGPNGASAIRRTPRAQATLPEDQDKVMLLFVPANGGQENGPRYDVQWMDIRPGRLPPGHLAIYNTTPLTFLGAVGRQVQAEDPDVLQIEPGYNRPLRVAPRASLLIAIRTEEDGILRLYENTFDCDPRQSLLFVLFPPRFPGSIHLGGKLIHIPLEEEPEPAPEEGSSGT